MAHEKSTQSKSAQSQNGNSTAGSSPTEARSKAETSSTSAAELPRYVPRKAVRVNARFLLIVVLVLGAVCGGTYVLHGWQMERNADSLLALAEEADEDGQTETAIQYLSQYLRFRPHDYDTKVRLADLIAASSQSVRARQTILGILEEVLRKDPHRADADELRRRAIDVSLGIGRYRDALAHLKILQEKQADGADDPELAFINGQCQEGLSDFDKAAELYLKVMQASPEMIGPYVRLAAVLRSHPDIAPYREELEASKAPDFDKQIESLFRRKPSADKPKTTPASEKTADDQPQTTVNGEPKTTADSVATSGDDEHKPSAANDRKGTAADFDGIAAIYDLLVKRGKPTFRARLVRANYAMSLHNYDDAQQDVDKALKLAGQEPEVLDNAVRLALARAEAASLQYDPQKRQQHLKTAERHATQGRNLAAPDNINFYLQLARIEQQRANVADDSDDRDAHLNAARRHLQDGKKQLSDYRDAEKPQTPETARELLGYEIGLLTLQVDLIITRFGANNTAADTANFQSSDDYDEYLQAMKRLRELGTGPEQIGLFQARTLLAQKKWRQAADQLALVRRRLQSVRNLRRQVDKALASCYRRLHLPDAGIQILKDGLNRDSLWHEGRLRLANLLAAEGRTDAALEHYRFLLQPDHAIAAAWLPLARLQIRRAADVPAERRDLSPVYAILDQVDNVSKSATAAGQAGPDDVTPLLLRMDAMFLDTKDAQRFQKIENLLDAALTQYKQALAAKGAAPKKAQKKSDGSTPKTAPHAADKLSRLYAARANFEAQRPDRDKAARIQSAWQLLDAAERTLDRNSILMRARVQIATRLGKERASPILKQLQSESAQLAKMEQAAVLETIARAYNTLGELDKSRTVWKKLTTLMPNDLGVRLATAMLAVRLNDRDWLQNELDVIRRIENGSGNNISPRARQSGGGRNGPWGNYFKALSLVVSAYQKREAGRKEIAALPDDDEERKVRSQAFIAQIQDDLEQARRLLNYCVRLRPNWTEPHHQLGRVAVLLGDREDAFRNFRRAIDLGDRTPRAFEFCVRYHISRKEFDRADALITLAGGPGAPLLSPGKLNLADRRVSLPELAVQVAYARGEIAKAQSYFAEESGDYRQQILLALLKFSEYQALTENQKNGSQGQKLLAEAEKYHRRAIEKAGDNPSPWLYMVVHLARLDRTEEAEATITQALNTLPKDVRDLTAARCYIVLGKIQQADKHFSLAVRARPDDARLRLLAARFYASYRLFSKAEKHLKAVLDSDSNATDAQRAVARHFQVLVTASGGRYSHLQKALKLLEDPATADLADLYTRAKILQKSSLFRDRLALIDVLKRIDRQKPLPSGDRFQLARLYEKTGRWKTARQIVDKLLEKHPQDQLLLGWYAAELLDNEPDTPKTRAKARKLIERLKALRPDSLSTAIVEAQLILAEEKPAHRDRAATVLETAVERMVKDRNQIKPAELAQIAMAARTCESFGLDAAAERLLRRRAELSGKPSSLLSVATFLGRQGRRTEGLKLCQEVAKTSGQSRNAAVAAVNIVSLGNAPASDLKTAEELLRAARKAEPDSQNLLFVSAEFFAAAGRHDEAADTYRQLLMVLPDDVAVMNNLAWLSALRGQNLQEALTWADRAIESSGPQAQLLDTRAVVLTKMGQADRAVMDLKQAIRESRNPTFFLHLAQAHLAAGNRPAAVSAMKQAFAEGLSIDRVHRLEQPGFREAVQATGVGD